MNASAVSDTNVTTSFTILVGLDFTEASRFAFVQAARISQGIPGSHLHLVHVLFETAPSEELRRKLADQLRAYVNENAAAIGGLKGVTIGIHLRVGKPVREIVQIASDVGAGLVVIGAHKGPHLKSWAVGSTAERLLAAAPCPVLVAGPTAAPEDHVPAIEPPCLQCLRARASSHGAEWWCERHAHHAKKANVFSYQRELPLAMPDTAVIPTGLKF